jgi:TM2 domain-containing membrane protein YozV
MVGPLVLSFGSPTSLGFVQSIMGVGLLAGSLLMSLWGGPKSNRIKFIFGGISLASLGFIVVGLQPELIYIAGGMFIFLFFIPVGSSPSSALFSAKVDPKVQGRVFATRSMISQSMIPLAFILSGVLADSVFNPLMVNGGKLADTFIGRILGTGPGRGIGLMLVCSGLILLIVSAVAYSHPRIRNIESEIPDAVLEARDADASLCVDEKAPSTG